MGWIWCCIVRLLCCLYILLMSGLQLLTVAVEFEGGRYSSSLSTLFLFGYTCLRLKVNLRRWPISRNFENIRPGTYSRPGSVVINRDYTACIIVIHREFLSFSSLPIHDPLPPLWKLITYRFVYFFYIQHHLHLYENFPGIALLNISDWGCRFLHKQFCWNSFNLSSE